MNPPPCHRVSALILLAWNFHFGGFLRLRGCLSCCPVFACVHNLVSSSAYAAIGVDLCLQGSLCWVVLQRFVRLHFHTPHQIYCPFCSSILREGNVIKTDGGPRRSPTYLFLRFYSPKRQLCSANTGRERITCAPARLSFFRLPPPQRRTHSSCLSFIYNDFGNSVSPATQPVTQPNPIKWL